MSLYYIATDYIEDNGLPKVGLVRVRVSATGSDSDPYVAFASKALGEKYLSLQSIDGSCRLLSYRELKSQGHTVDKNKGTVVFETEEQIIKSVNDKTCQYLRNLVQ